LAILAFALQWALALLKELSTREKREGKQ